MNLAYRTLFAGMLSLVFCGTAIAHDSHHGDWSGGISIAVAPGGHVSWGGGLNYGPVTHYPARYVVLSAPYRGQICRHPSHRNPGHHWKGHRHGKKHPHR